MLRESEYGKELVDTPERWLPAKDVEVCAVLKNFAQEVIDSVNFYVEHEEMEHGSAFDPKVVFKSKTGVSKLENDVLRESLRQAKRDPGFLFSVPPEISDGEE